MFWNKEKVFEVTIGLKSGREVVLRCTSFKVNKDGDKPTSLEWKLHKSNKFDQLLLINLDQIESITSKEV